jgi:phage/plasmid-like protein (TIGR03299 family)
MSTFANRGDIRVGSMAHDGGFAIDRTMFGQNGEVLTEAPDFEAAFAKAGWDYEVEKAPAYVQTEEGVFQPAKDCFVTRRVDTGAALGHVGPRYHVQQNRNAMEKVIPLLDEGLARFEAGGTLAGGRRAWGMLRFDTNRINEILGGVTESLFFEEQVLPYGIIIIDHSGQASNTLLQVPYRAYCLNVLPGLLKAGNNGASKVRHTRSVKAKFAAEANRLFGGMVVRYKQYAQIYSIMRDTQLTKPAFSRIVLDTALPLREVGPESTSRQVAARSRQLDRRSRVIDLWDEGAAHRGDHSAWEALNGLIEALDHGEEFQSRVSFAANLDGSRVQVKRKVMRKLLRYRQSADYRETMDAPFPLNN